jgi:hypothetical protein
MEAALDTIRNAPRYLLGLLAFVGALGFGLVKLLGLLHSVGL